MAGSLGLMEPWSLRADRQRIQQRRNRDSEALTGEPAPSGSEQFLDAARVVRIAGWLRGQDNSNQ